MFVVNFELILFSILILRPGMLNSPDNDEKDDYLVKIDEMRTVDQVVEVLTGVFRGTVHQQSDVVENSLIVL